MAVLLSHWLAVVPAIFEEYVLPIICEEHGHAGLEDL
jgi:hypothetical protein